MRTDYEASCEGKRPYDSRRDARAAANVTRSKDKRHKRGRLQPYRCPYGEHWHVGHVSDGELHRRNPRVRAQYAA